MINQIKLGALDVKIEEAIRPDGLVVPSLLAAFPQTLAIYAFGSRTQGTARPDSDLDLAILVEGYAEPLQLWEMASQLNDALGCPVDLLDFRLASTVMQYQVLMHGKLLWSVQPQAGLFECYVLSEKLELDAARAGLLDDIAAKGKVYGG